LRLDNVAKSYRGRQILAPLSLEIAPGRTTVLIGPSGCGKSTLLRMLLGLLQPDRGRVLFHGEALTPANADAVRHRVGYVIQDGGLFPHLTAEQNVALLARYLGRSESWIAQRISELIALTRIDADALGRYPRELSGGQRQRVGLMRALMLDPEALLLDEPLGALDPITRAELQAELKTLFAQLGKTVVMVTHDMSEAALFADEIVLLRAGRIVQRGQLADLLQRPAEPYVHDFIRAQRSHLPPAPPGQPPL
jgi:osmoprotectant transport system ATP-binding protein